jgi:hypothetical protein
MIKEDPPSMNYLAPVIYQDQLFGSIIPQPASLFYYQSKQFSDAVISLLEKFPDNVTMVFGNNDNDDFNIIDKDLYYTFLSYKISSLTSLIMFVECFLNSMIPDDYQTKNKKGIDIDKGEIERRWGLKEKLKDVIPKVVQVESIEKYQTQYGKFLEFNTLRNHFIHLKTTRNEKNLDPFLDHFQNLINLDLKKSIEETEVLIKMIDPKYFD